MLKKLRRENDSADLTSLTSFAVLPRQPHLVSKLPFSNPSSETVTDGFKFDKQHFEQPATAAVAKSSGLTKPFTS
jgi:hypothetical protein